MGKKRRGIILISTLFLIFLLVLMSSAFLNINSNNLRLTVNVKNQELAVLAAMSGVQYAKMRIEQYPNTETVSWGKCVANCSTGSPTFDFNNIAIPTGVATTNGFETITETPGTGVVTGTLKGGEASFRMVFTAFAATTEQDGTPTSYNNIWNPAAQNRETLRSVPARCAHLIVVGTAGGVSRTVEVLLKKQALTNSSAFAGNDLKVGTTTSLGSTTSNGLWSINSLDPFDNSVRANGNIIAPSLGVLPSLPSPFSSNPSPQITFTGGGSGSLDPGGASLGAIVAKKNIGFASSITSAPDITIGDGVKDADETAYVKQQTGGILYPNTESPPPQDLSASNFTPGAGKCIYTIAGGVYNITASDKIKLPDGSTSGTVPFTTNGSCASSPDLKVKDYMLRIPKDINVQANGNFTLNTILAGKKAKLGLGYDEDGVQEGGTSPNFHVAGGDITINGELTGEGGVVADKSNTGGNVTLNGKSVLSTDPSSGLVVYAEGNVTINPPVSTGQTSGNSDFIAYKNAVANPSAGLKTGDWLHKWGEKGADKSTDAATLGTTNVGTAVWNDPSQKLTISPADGSPPIIISIPSISAPLQIGEGYFPCSIPTSITLGQYIRAKKSEDVKESDWLKPKISGGHSEGEVKDLIENKIDVFWSDKEKIEDQLASKLEDLHGADKFNNNTGANPNPPYCTGCTKYKDYKDKDALVGFSDYWQGPSVPGGGAKFSDSSKEYEYKTNYGVLWSNSKYISQTLVSQDAEFTGVIYTKGNLIADMGGYKFFIEGAIIARNGDITIDNANNVLFLYNPEYLSKFINQAGSGVQCRVAQVFWVMW